MEKWMDDIKMAIQMAKTSNGPLSDLLTHSLADSSKSQHNAESGAETWWKRPEVTPPAEPSFSLVYDLTLPVF